MVRARRKLKIKGLRLHDLRHEATSSLSEKGLTPTEVSTMTGHKTPNTLKRYTHLDVTAIARELDSGLRGGAQPATIAAVDPLLPFASSRQNA